VSGRSSLAATVSRTLGELDMFRKVEPVIMGDKGMEGEDRVGGRWR
jgi:hypothetical protein